MQNRFATGGLLLLILFVSVGSATAQTFGGVLAATDNQIMVSRTAYDGGEGQIFVFERGADGTLIEQTPISAPDSDGSDDNFGRALVLQGNRMAVGATGFGGTVGSGYLFEKQSDGTWKNVWSGHPEDVDDSDYFGRSAALAGDWAFFGTAGHRANSGAVYAYRRGSDGTWSQHSKITAKGFRPNAYFGIAIAADGPNLLVSAPFVDGGQIHAFRYDAGTDAFESLGLISGEEGIQTEALAIKGNMAFAGVPRAGDGQGGVQVFHLDSTKGSWSMGAMLQPFDGQNAGMGASIAVIGDELWAGAPGAEGAAGGVYRFTLSADGPSAAFVTVPADAIRGAGAGAALAGAGTLAVLGAPTFGPTGLAYVLQSRGGVWESTQILGDQTGLSAITGGEILCEDNTASGYDCDNVDLLSFLPVHDVGGGPGGSVKVNDLWGWTDEDTGREFVILGRIDGTSFVEVTDAYNPVYLGNLPMTEGSNAATWRDIKVYKDHAYIVADGAGDHGVQVFDLRQLRDIKASEAPLTFEETAHYDGVASAHNIVINEESGFAFTVGNRMGGQTCGGGYHIINIQEPANPTFAGCWGHEGTGNSGTGYSHDAQCVIYRGPDTDYTGREICFGGNENAISIADLTDKAAPKAISSASYPNVAYTHQGWLSTDQRFLYVNDEIDELQGVERTRTLVWDVTDLDEPILVKEHMGETPASDHNLYVKDNFMYQSNYAAGLRILDITDPANPREVGFFDTTPGLSNAAGYTGSWSNYPYFKSGTIAVSSVGEGLFLLKKRQIDT